MYQYLTDVNIIKLSTTSGDWWNFFLTSHYLHLIFHHDILLYILNSEQCTCYSDFYNCWSNCIYWLYLHVYGLGCFFFKIIYNIVSVFLNCLLHVGLVPTEVLGVYFVNNSLNFFISQGIWNSLQAGKTQYISSLYSASWCQCRKPRDGIGKSNEGKNCQVQKSTGTFLFKLGWSPSVKNSQV